MKVYSIIRGRKVQVIPVWPIRQGTPVEWYLVKGRQPRIVSAKIAEREMSVECSRKGKRKWESNTLKAV